MFIRLQCLIRKNEAAKRNIRGVQKVADFLTCSLISVDICHHKWLFSVFFHKFRQAVHHAAAHHHFIDGHRMVLTARAGIV